MTRLMVVDRGPTPAFEPDQLDPTPHRAGVDQIQVSPEDAEKTFAKVRERNAAAPNPLGPSLVDMRSELDRITSQAAHWTAVRDDATSIKAGLESALDAVADTLAEEKLSRADRKALNEKAEGLAWRIAKEEKRIKAAEALVARYKAELKAFDAPLLRTLEAEHKRSQRISAALGA